MSTPGIAEGFVNQGQLTPENLIAGEFPRIARVVTVTGNGPLPLGTVLGRITTDGRYLWSDVNASDGSEIPDAILAESIDTTVNDVQATVYLTGEFNELALSLGPGHTLESIRQHFRARSLFLRRNQP